MATLILRLWNRVSTWVVPLLVGLGGALGLVVAHKRRVRQGEKEGAQQERQRIHDETTAEVTRRKERSDEIDQTIADLPDDELRDRMFKQARSRDR